MKENTLVELSRAFAVDIVKQCTAIEEKRRGNVLVNQLLRSGTSIGANIHEGNYASSKSDFINKFRIALKECYETEYWLGLFKDVEYISTEQFDYLYSKSSKLRKLLIASINTANANLQNSRKDNRPCL